MRKHAAGQWLRAALVVMSAPATTACWAVDLPAARLDAVVQSYVDRGYFTGTVLVARGDEVLLNKGYGLAQREWMIANTPDTKFRLASVSKQFTAAAILRLVDRGQLKLDVPVSLYLADTPASWAEVTTRHLLTHSSGIPNYTDFETFQQFNRHEHAPKALYALFRDKPLDFKPGDASRYSNSGYAVLGLLIEARSGKRYESFLRDEIFTPLAMLDSGYAHGEALIAKRAAGYTQPGKTIANAAYTHMSVPYAAGGLYSTTGDLLKWHRGLYEGRLLSAASLRQMTTVAKDDFAMGLIVRDEAGGPVYFHAGGIFGFSTFLQYAPRARLTIAVLGNLEQARSQHLTALLSRVASGQAVTLIHERTVDSLPSHRLAEYEGAYQLDTDTRLWIVARDRALWVRINNAAWTQVLPQSEQLFFAPDDVTELRFTRNRDGAVQSLTLSGVPGDKTWTRIELPLPTLAMQTIYLRGSMNNWSTEHPIPLLRAGQHQIEIDLAAGEHALKVASTDYQAVDLGQADQEEPLRDGGSIALIGVGRNIALALDKPSRCTFTVASTDVLKPQLDVRCVPRSAPQ
jgi:CubicO group peptidase (beta-lactamase class C family)